MNIQFQDINLEVIPDKNHEWLLETALVAEGYGVKDSSVRSQKLTEANSLSAPCVPLLAKMVQLKKLKV